MSVELIRELYEYHHWANRRLFGIAADLGDGVTMQDMGKHWSFPTFKSMLAHIYGADRIWLARWKGAAPTKLYGDADFSSLADFRTQWDELEAEQRAFVTSLGTAELARTLDYKATNGTPFAQPLWQLLQHVVNHATHHRSELAAMLTMTKGSPPSTDMVVFYRQARS